MSIALPSPHRRRVLPDVLVLIRLAAVVLALGLVWLGYVMLDPSQDIGDAGQQGLRIAELRERIAFLDEKLTMSARMAALSGDVHWVDQVAQTVPVLDDAIAAATMLATSEMRRDLTETLIEAHRDLRAMERRGVALVEAGDLSGAQHLLNGPEFQYLRDVFATGLDVLGRSLLDGVHARAAQVNRRAWLRAVSFGLMGAMLVVALMAAQQRVRLRAAAGIDPLTQLPNRRQFYAHLSTRLEQQGVAVLGCHALVMLGIDHFKALNDSYGHAVADRLLKSVAERLQTAISAGAFVARVGGDEFAVLIDGPFPRAEGDCPAQRVVQALVPPFCLDNGDEIRLGVSAGAVWVTSKVGAVADAMRQAGAALRQAKRDGGGCLRVFDHAMDAQSRDRALLEADLRHAIDRDDIVPFFQPLMDLQSGLVIGVEALARWRHDVRGWISPAIFIPLAEELGLIDALMERLLRQVCRAALHWPAHVTVAFNVSPLQLRNDALPGRVRTILAETGFPARRLEIEVTESALVTDLELARRLLEELRAYGVRLALDDFGTGYSSLKHLRCLPFDKLKIDASFVGGMVDDPESGKIVAAVVGLGHSLGLSTVAEGVETSQVAEALRDLGCDIGQGWLFGRPVPAAALDFGSTPKEQAA